MITFKSFMNQLALRGFHDKEKLEKIWQHIHEHNAVCMDFSEFLVMMFLWGEVGQYDLILDTPSNSDTVRDAFAALQNNWIMYCKDKSLKIHHDELYKLMSEKMPHLLDHSHIVIERYFPLLQSGTSDELPFSKFMHLLYCCFVELSKNSNGNTKKYMSNGIMKHLIIKRRGDLRTFDSSGENSVAWEFLHKAFSVLESDFISFEKDTNGNIEFKVLTTGVPAMAGVHLFDVLSRLEGVHDRAEYDWDDGIDFNDFLFIVFLMTSDGSYSRLVGSSQDHRQVRSQMPC